MPFNWGYDYPHTDFHELNLDWFNRKFKEIFAEWASLYATMLNWKEETDTSLAEWKNGVVDDMTTWENNLLDALATWKSETTDDISEWERGVISDLNDWKDTFLSAYEALEDRVEAIVSDTEDMVENLASPFSSSANYLKGEYVVQTGVLYRFTADHSAGAWTGSDAEQVTAMQDIDDLTFDNLFDEYISNSGEFKITSSFLENGIWRIGNKQSYSTRGRVKRLIPVKQGMILKFDVDDFDIFYGVASDRTWTVYAQGGDNGTWVTEVGSHSVRITVDGYLVVLIRNHGAASTDVDVSNFSQNCAVTSNILENIMTFFDVSELDSFSVADMPSNSFTYGAYAVKFTDCPDDISDDAYISIRKELMNNPTFATLWKVTVYDAISQFTYTATYRGGSSPLLWPWRKILTNADRPITNNRTCNIFKRVLCVGDSYTEGYINTSGSGGAYPDYSWVNYMTKITGNEWINCGVTGANSSTWLSNNAGLAKATTEGRVQAYIIQLMINDYNDLALGTTADIGTDAVTYYGCYSKIIRELHNISPNAIIFTCTCPYLSDKTAFQNAVREISELYANDYNVHLLDFKADQKLFQNKSLSDDLTHNHYTALGYEQMAEIYAYYISNYINNNVEDFQNVYAIPYDS